MAGLLRNAKHEKLAQLMASGTSVEEANLTVGLSSRSQVVRRREVQDRIEELIAQGEARAIKQVELSRSDILTRIFDDWNLARKLGQVSAALKAGELLGKELHKMFVDRKEIGGPGDFDNKTEDELREFILKNLVDLGISTEIAVKMVDDASADPNSIKTISAGTNTVN